MEKTGYIEYMVTEEQVGGKVLVTLRDKATDIGLRFVKGEPLQRYISELIVPSAIIEGASAIENMNNVCSALTQEAEKAYPMEFAELNTK